MAITSYYYYNNDDENDNNDNDDDNDNVNNNKQHVFVNTKVNSSTQYTHMLMKHTEFLQYANKR
jgi:hypothetical protein